MTDTPAKPKSAKRPSAAKTKAPTGTTRKTKAAPKPKPVKCTFCAKEYKSEAGLIKHKCEKKTRHLNRDTPEYMLAFMVFQTFYSKSGISKTPPTYETFCDSRLFTDFFKFAQYLHSINPMMPDKFVDHLIKKQLPITDWTKPTVYEAYVRQMVRVENWNSAFSRFLTLTARWSEETGYEQKDYFRVVSTSRVLLYLESGRISPWVFMNCISGSEVFGRMSEEERSRLARSMDAAYWSERFKIVPKEVAAITKELTDLGL